MAGGKGGKKIKMVKMENKSHLQVTFSKRRSSLFNKANQLCTLCAAKVLLIVFSPTGKVYSFGNPSAETLIHHFLSDHPKSPHVASAEREDVQQLNTKYAELMGELEDANKRAAELKEKERAMKEGGLWCGEIIDELDLNQLMNLKASLEQLQRNIVAVQIRRSRIIMADQAPSSSSSYPAAAATSTGGGVQWLQPYNRFGNNNGDDQGF